MRILIAEDEVELAGALKFLLEKNRFSVDVVHDGEEALERFQAHPLFPAAQHVPVAVQAHVPEGQKRLRASGVPRRDAEEDAKTLHPGGHGGFRDGDGDAAGGNQSCKFL